MSTQNKLICPACGAEMNHHAEKLIYASPGEPGYNLSHDGAVEESHTCMPRPANPVTTSHTTGLSRSPTPAPAAVPPPPAAKSPNRSHPFFAAG